MDILIEINSAAIIALEYARRKIESMSHEEARKFMAENDLGCSPMVLTRAIRKLYGFFRQIIQWINWSLQRTCRKNVSGTERKSTRGSSDNSEEVARKGRGMAWDAEGVQRDLARSGGEELPEKSWPPITDIQSQWHKKYSKQNVHSTVGEHL